MAPCADDRTCSLSDPVRSVRKPAIRRDADGATSIDRSWASLTERLIVEAQERGDFDDLPGHGRPLVLDSDPREGDMGLAFHILRNARLAPPWIEADKLVRRCIDDMDQLVAQAGAAAHRDAIGRMSRHRLQRQLEGLMDTHDAAVASLNAMAPSVALHRRPLDRAGQRLRLAEALDVRHDLRRDRAASGPPVSNRSGQPG